MSTGPFTPSVNDDLEREHQCLSFLEQLAYFIKKSKQFDHSDIVRNIATLTLTLSVNRPYTVIGETPLQDLVRSYGLSKLNENESGY